MKKFTLFLTALFFAAVSLTAQNVPQGMNYQAVARDAKGEILPNKKISIQITLLADSPKGEIAYQEIHQVQTNDLGLFSMSVGEGQPVFGDFQEVPWNKSQIWMSIGMDDSGGDEFVLLNTTRLLAVPYAFHAGSAETLYIHEHGEKRPCRITGLPFWSILGNDNVTDTCHFIGTTIPQDLIFKTDNIERMRITAAGDLELKNSLIVGGDLIVKKNAFLNTEEGETMNHGPFTVADQSPTLLSGTLTVDLATDLNASLNVDGPTNLNSSLSVNFERPTTLTGTLLTQGAATFIRQVRMDDTLNSSGITSGALVVRGGLGLARNLYVGGAANFGGSTSFGGAVNITDATQSVNPMTGALVVTGGAGIGGNLNVGGDVKFDKTLSIVTAGTLSNSSPNTGLHVAHFENTGNGSGIQIKVGAATPHNNNNFITFLNSSGTTVGRIEGENGDADLANNREYQDTKAFLITDIVIAATAEAIAIAEEVQAVVALTAASTSSTGCAGLGACITAPIPSFIVSETANLIVKTANLVVQTANLVKVSANLVVFENTHEALFGITFASGAEDYAEYLPKLNPEDDFLPGEVVGVKNGYITRNTEGADRIMVISHKPAVLGGLPQDGNEDHYEMVAFMGQVPTRMFGEVAPGDFILPSGFHNGLAIGRHPSKMKPEDYKKIIGIAWSGSEGNDLSMVKAAVGLTTNDLADLVVKQGEELKAQLAELEELKNQVARTNEILAELVPGFREAAGLEKSSARIIAAETSHADSEVHIAHPGEGDIVYYELSDEELEAGFKLAEDIFMQTGLDLNEHPFWNRIYTDPGYKEEVADNVRTKFRRAVHTHQKINEEIKR